MSIEKKLTELEAKFEDKIKVLEEKNKKQDEQYKKHKKKFQVYEALIKKMYDLPEVVTSIAEYNAEIQKISKAMAYNRESVVASKAEETDMSDFQKKLAKKQQKLEEMVKEFVHAHAEYKVMGDL